MRVAGDGLVTIDQRAPLVEDPLTDLAATGLEELIESTVELRRQLITHETLCRRVLADVRDHAAVGCTLSAVRVDRWRSAVTESIREFETVRHRTRLVLVAMSLDEGMSIAEIARSWGVSRQLASRWVREAATLRAPGAVVGPQGEPD